MDPSTISSFLQAVQVPERQDSVTSNVMSSCDKAFVKGVFKITVGAIVAGPLGAGLAFCESTFDLMLNC